MRIVHTESSLGWGGQELRILAEAAGLARRGHEMVIVAPPESKICKEAPRWGLAIDAVPIGRKSIAGFRAMREWLRRHPVDLVNTHSSTDSWLTALAVRTLKVSPPIVRTRHVSAAIPSNLTTRWLYTRAASAIVTTGESLREQLVQVNHFPADRIVSIPTGMDPERFKPGDKLARRAELALPTSGLIIGIVATLRSWKGHRFLIDAVASLKRNDVCLVIVGDGPQRAALETRIIERGLKHQVRMVGNQDDVVPWLQAFDLFSLPSYANEGVPQALVQASMVGLAAVTTSIGAISEVAVEGETAIVVKPQDVADLTRGLNTLLDDALLRDRLGQAARARAVSRFSYTAMLDRMEALFQGVVNGSNNKGGT
jgi:glycosyltransferase involved in cell wall biosynthesis